MNILNYSINTKYQLKDFLNTLKKILNTKTHQFPISGKYLLKNGMQQSAQIGKVLKKIEEEWIRNNFKISKDQIKDIIRLNSN